MNSSDIATVLTIAIGQNSQHSVRLAYLNFYEYIVFVVVFYLVGGLVPGSIKTHGSESQGQEEAACTSIFRPT